MKKGDAIFVVNDWSNPETIQYGIFQSQTVASGEKYITLEGSTPTSPRIHNAAYVFPLSAQADVLTVVYQRMQLKQAYDESMKLVYEVCNKRSRGEYP